MTVLPDHSVARNLNRLLKTVGLRLPEGRALGLSAVAGAAASDIDMIRMALVIRVINTLLCFTINTDRLTGMLQRADISALTSLRKALAAGFITVAGMCAPYHDIALAAIILLIIAAVFHATF